MRIGQSVDIHPLKENRKLILGGVEIEYSKGLYGHSDADALTHAIAESILGALALGDLGKHFPDTDSRYKDISSLILLEHVCELLQNEGYKVGNIDALILAEKPKMSPYIMNMRENIAKCLKTDVKNVSIKATRGEKIGFVGREEGIVSTCICLLEEM